MQPHEDKKPFYRVTVDFLPDLHGQLKKLGEVKRTSQSDILRQAIGLMASLQERLEHGEKIVSLNKEGKETSEIKF